MLNNETAESLTQCVIQAYNGLTERYPGFKDELIQLKLFINKSITALVNEGRPLDNNNLHLIYEGIDERTQHFCFDLTQVIDCIRRSMLEKLFTEEESAEDRHIGCEQKIYLTLATTEKTARDYLKEGIALANTGRHKEAIGPLQKAIELEPGNVAYAYSTLISCFERLGRNKDALKTAKKAVLANPYDTTFLGLLRPLFNNETAAKYFHEVLQANAHAVEGSNKHLRGAFFQANENAIKCFHEEHQVNAHMTEDNHKHLGCAFFHINDHEEAVKHFQKALKTKPNDVDVLSFLSESYIKTNQFESAEIIYRRALSINPRHTQVVAMQMLLGYSTRAVHSSFLPHHINQASNEKSQ